jgi:GTPase
MALPIVAIVGRPNVGKSSLFNWLAGRRISIVDPTAGVTRDRVSTVVEYEGRPWEIMDTGGIGIVDVDDLSADVERQIQLALQSAAVVVFVVDVRDGVVPLDEDVAVRLRAIKKPIVLCANKADTEKIGQTAGEFFKLGHGEPVCVSADQKLGKDELFAAIAAKLPPDTGEAAPDAPALKIAIVGRRNAGKSTFINALAGAERVIVSEVPGTTRDSVDVIVERDGTDYLLIDTAGVRKRSMLANDIEFYSLHRAQRSIRRADVVMHFFDARHRVGRVDKQLAEYIAEEHKPAIFVMNKWDLLKEHVSSDKMGEYVREMLPMLDHVPIAFVTAKKGKNALRLLQLAKQLHKQAGTRVGTGDLNRVIRAAIEASPPPMSGSKQPRVYYVTQVGVHPPTIVLFTNGPELFEETYVRYLTKVLRDSFPFSEVALKVVLRARGEGSGPRPEADEPDVPPTDDSSDDEPILRAPRPEPEVPEEAPRPRKRPQRGSETWDF